MIKGKKVNNKVKCEKFVFIVWVVRCLQMFIPYLYAVIQLTTTIDKHLRLTHVLLAHKPWGASDLSL